MTGASRYSTPGARAGLVAVAAFFCLPLFFGLQQLDLHNDESIYAYAVDRILETGDWLTPRSIQVDGPFLEKPPLKFWLTAAAIKTGVAPYDERGMRFVDAVAAAMAFVYVYLFARRLGGTLAGVAAGLVLFTLGRFVFDHGIRSNNMEAALVLAYCGGLYHFARWEEQSATSRAWPDALAVIGYFVLGFMTKFVAAIFMPLVCLLALLWRPSPLARLRASWTTWLVGGIVALALIAPWFVYESMVFGRQFWAVIFGEHIYARFTVSLDPSHLHPWHYYFVETWKELSESGSQWIAAAGLAALAFAAVARASWPARLVLLWWAVPSALLCIGSSKLFHYYYPFLPPLAIGAGYLASLLATAIAAGIRRLGEREWPGTARLLTLQRRAVASDRARQLLLAGAVLAFAIAIGTIASGDLVLTVGDVRWFRNSSIVRPIVIGAALLWLRGSVAAACSSLALVPLLVLLPVYDYHPTIERLSVPRHPLRALRDCVAEVQRNAGAERGVYNAARPLTYHSYYYYLHRLGPWTEADHPDKAELARRVLDAEKQTPILLSLEDYDAELPLLPLMNTPQGLAAFSIALEEGVVVLLPGPYNVCVDRAVAAGAALVDTSRLSRAAQ